MIFVFKSDIEESNSAWILTPATLSGSPEGGFSIRSHVYQKYRRVDARLQVLGVGIIDWRNKGTVWEVTNALLCIIYSHLRKTMTGGESQYGLHSSDLNTYMGILFYLFIYRIVRYTACKCVYEFPLCPNSGQAHTF